MGGRRWGNFENFPNVRLRLVNIDKPVREIFKNFPNVVSCLTALKYFNLIK
jgi:hypothetical protein